MLVCYDVLEDESFQLQQWWRGWRQLAYFIAVRVHTMTITRDTLQGADKPAGRYYYEISLRVDVRLPTF